MAYVTTTRIEARHGAGRISGLFDSLKTAIARRRIYSQTLSELNQLSDRELADLGLSRFSIVQTAYEAAYGE